MSKETYSIPKGPTARFDFERSVITLCTTNFAIWNIPEEILTRIAPLRISYELKFNIANNKSTQSPAATADREAAWKALEVEIINLYDHHILNNDAISAADKEALNIHFRGGNSGIPAPAPVTIPIVTLVSEGVSMLYGVYSDSAASGTHYKPANVAFCELWCKVGNGAPASINECIDRFNLTHSHEAIIFKPEQRGQTVYAYARWVNKNGKTGPWGNMITALIP